MQTVLGLDHFKKEAKWHEKAKGNVALLCHAASVNKDYDHAIDIMRDIFGKRLIKLFGPQHGLVSDVQDNMIETEDFKHPYYDLPVYSLYSKTRIPTDEMLKDVDTMIIDLQDVGTRIYTYIYTMTLMMKACEEKGIHVIVLDRPNPIDGVTIEGNMLDEERFSSFVGLHPLPTRHALTIGEVAQFVQKHHGHKAELTIVPMLDWKREYTHYETKLPWVLPSPNLPTIDGCYTFVGTVLFEGTNISEGRGTSRGLEIIGHPDLDPHKFLDKISPLLKEYQIEGLKLRPMYFLPTFQKHANVACGGYQIHITDYQKARPWVLSQLLCKELYKELEDFKWKQPPYEYEFEKLPIDLINGDDSIKNWIETDGSYDELIKLENINRQTYLDKRAEILIY